MSRSRRRKGYVRPAGLSLGFIETFHVLYPVILKVKVGKGDSMSHIRKEKHVQAHRASAEHTCFSVPAALQLRGD